MASNIQTKTRDEHSLRALPRHLWAWLSHRWRETAARQRLAAEFTALSNGDGDRVLAEIGIGRAELADAVRGSTRARSLLNTMIVRLGIVPAFARADAGTIRDIERRCTICHAQRRCRRWLASGADKTAYRQFCPNAAIFDQFILNRRSTGL